MTLPRSDRGGFGSDDPDPDDLVAAVLTCPAVARMDGGRFGETVTYLPGRRVAGITVSARCVTVSVVGTSTATATTLLGQIWAAVAGQLAGRQLCVEFADIELTLP